MMTTKLPVTNWTNDGISTVTQNALIPGRTAVDVSRAQPKLPSSFLEDDAPRESLLELFGYLGGVIRTPIVNDDDFVVELAVKVSEMASQWSEAYCSVKVSLRSLTMIGRFFRSLYVGKITLYLFLEAIAAK
jgi:hypothetical protein